MTKPSVGRIVHYLSYGTPGGEYPKACRKAFHRLIFLWQGLCHLVCNRLNLGLVCRKMGYLLLLCR